MCSLHGQQERDDDPDLQTSGVLQEMRFLLQHEEPPQEGMPYLQKGIQENPPSVV